MRYRCAALMLGVGIAAVCGGCRLCFLPDGEPPDGAVVVETIPAARSRESAINYLATSLIARGMVRQWSGRLVRMPEESDVLAVWKQAYQALHWRRPLAGEGGTVWDLVGTHTGAVWHLELRDGDQVLWQAETTLWE